MSKDDQRKPGQRGGGLLATLLVICLPVIAATFSSGTLFKLGTLEPGKAYAANSYGAPAGGTETVLPSLTVSPSGTASITLTPGTTGTPGSTGNVRIEEEKEIQ